MYGLLIECLFRNGGHVTPILYHDYAELKAAHGKDMARKIIRFRLSHFQELLSIATEENLLEESQCREVEALDAFFELSLYNEAKGKLETYKKDLPEESSRYQIYEGSDEIKVSRFPFRMDDADPLFI